MRRRSANFRLLGRFAADCSHDIKAHDILLLDVRRISSLADYYLLASVDSVRQLKAVQQNITDEVEKRFGFLPVHKDGGGSVQWMVLDYGGVVIHLMSREARDFYSLERLYAGARPVSLNGKGLPRKSPKKHKK